MSNSLHRHCCAVLSVFAFSMIFSGFVWANEPVTADTQNEFTTTPSGLKYKILRKGSGPKPKVTDTVTVNYRGWLDNGKEFDSSYKRGKPLSFPLNRVIPGWTEGMQLVGKGGMI